MFGMCLILPYVRKGSFRPSPATAGTKAAFGHVFAAIAFSTQRGSDDEFFRAEMDDGSTVKRV